MKKIFFVIILSSVLLASRSYAQGEPEKYGWSFVNFGTAVLSWDIFRHTMFGIPQDSSGITAPFDLLFYNEVFKTKLAGPGNCFGLSLLSILMTKDGGHLGFCCPTNIHGGTSGVGPTDPKLLRAINIMHGHQVTLAALQSFFDQFLDGHSQNATYAVALAKQTLEKEGAFLVSVTKNLSPSDGGHTLIGYKVQHLGGAHYRIFVVDPNHIWEDSITAGNRDWYLAGNNYIDCNGAVWKYDMFGSGIWPSGSGHLTVLPVTVAGPTGRVPSSLGIAIGEFLNKIFIGNDGEGATITQIRQNGKRLYHPGTRDVDWGGETGIRTIMPWFPSASTREQRPFQFETYFNFSAMQNVEVDFSSGTKGAKVAIGDNTGYALINCSDANVSATISVVGLSTNSPSVIIKNVSKDATFDIDIMIPTKVGERNRFFSIKTIQANGGKGETIFYSIERSNTVILRGTSSQTAELVINQQAINENNTFTTEAIPVVPKDGIQLTESDWAKRVIGASTKFTGR